MYCFFFVFFKTSLVLSIWLTWLKHLPVSSTLLIIQVTEFRTKRHRVAVLSSHYLSIHLYTLYWHFTRTLKTVAYLFFYHCFLMFDAIMVVSVSIDPMAALSALSSIPPSYSSVFIVLFKSMLCSQQGPLSNCSFKYKCSYYQKFHFS